MLLTPDDDFWGTRHTMKKKKTVCVDDAQRSFHSATCVMFTFIFSESERKAFICFMSTTDLPAIQEEANNERREWEKSRKQRKNREIIQKRVRKEMRWGWERDPLSTQAVSVCLSFHFLTVTFIPNARRLLIPETDWSLIARHEKKGIQVTRQGWRRKQTSDPEKELFEPIDSGIRWMNCRIMYRTRRKEVSSWTQDKRMPFYPRDEECAEHLNICGATKYMQCQLRDIRRESEGRERERDSL